jgi:GeoRSP system SPASM domain protein
MALDLLDTPLRATWDLHDGRSGMPSPLAAQVAQRLTDAQVFYLTLDLHPLLHADVVDLVRDLSAAGCQVEVCTGSSADELARLPELPETVPVLLDVAPFCLADGLDFVGLGKIMDDFRAMGRIPVFSLVPNRDNIGLLGALFAFSQRAGIARFKLPNLRINDTFRQTCQPFMVTPSDLDRLRLQVSDAAAFRSGLQLDVHDLFLWEILFPDGGTARSEYGGCQAANSLAHVDLQATVHPCNSWPHPLGHLAVASFDVIWSSPDRLAIRQNVAMQPAGCCNCRDYAICFGGCRGLARELPTIDGRDPMCAGRR